MFNSVLTTISLDPATELTVSVGTWAGGRGIITANQTNDSTDWSATLVCNSVQNTGVVATPGAQLAHFDIPPGPVSIRFKENGGISVADIGAVITAITQLNPAS